MDFLGSIIAYPFRWINMLFPNYVMTLIFFAIFMKIVLFPFGIKQQKNSIKQASLRPYETIIRKKYAGRNDKISQQKLNQELMELYQRENFNPMAGCFPMLIQLPILFALYNVIVNPAKHILRFPKEILDKISEISLMIENKAANEIGQIDKILTYTGNDADIKARINELYGMTVGESSTNVGTALQNLSENFKVGSINLMEQPQFSDFNILWIIPALVLVFSFLSMKLTRKFTYQPQPANGDVAANASFKLMDITMPLMSAWISFITPAGVGIYWIIQNILGVVQQFILYKMYPIPVMTDEDLKLAEKELRGKAKQQKPAIREQEDVPPTRVPGQKKKHAQNSIGSKAKITAHGKKRVKEYGQPPRAIRRP